MIRDFCKPDIQCAGATTTNLDTAAAEHKSFGKPSSPSRNPTATNQGNVSASHIVAML